jgi:hypothetical protein
MLLSTTSSSNLDETGDQTTDSATTTEEQDDDDDDEGEANSRVRDVVLRSPSELPGNAVRRRNNSSGWS